MTPTHLQRIGIVACSAEGAALCYRTICAEGPRGLGPHARPEVYPEKLVAVGLECLRPHDAERDELDRIIMDELVAGVSTAQGVSVMSPKYDRPWPCVLSASAWTATPVTSGVLPSDSSPNTRW